jgi:di/tricarboxylate transporter
MTGEILTVLLLLGGAVVLFATERLSVDVTSLLLLFGLYLTGIVEPADLLQGFSNEVVLFIGTLFVLGEALVRTGTLDPLERRLAALATARPEMLLPVLVAGAAAISGFLSNTATMAAMLPLATSLARRLKTPPSKLLMPIAFGSILGGSMTLIGTSTNVVVSGLLPRYELEPLGLFELAPVAFPAAVLGGLYLVTFGKRLLPERAGETLDLYGMREYLAEVTVPDGSSWIGKRLAEIDAALELDLTILGHVEGRRIRPVAPRRPLAAGDVLLVKADQDALLKLEKRKQLDLAAAEQQDEEEGRGRELRVHEVVVANNSRLAGRSLRELDFRRRYGATVLATYRRGGARRRRLADLRLREGDVLLLQGEIDQLRWFLQQGELILLDEAELPQPGWRAGVAGGVFVAMLVAGAAGWMPFHLAALAAALVTVLAGCIHPDDAYRAVDWRILVMIASLLVLSTAMETSGTAEYVADGIVALTGDLGPVALLAGFYVLTVVLTQPMSNQASALVVLPLALRTATATGLEPRAFAVTVALAASCSFVTPLEPASLLVYGPGRYRFRDFFVVGWPLTLLVMVVTLLLVPRLWPLDGG